MAVNKFYGLTEKEVADFFYSLEPEQKALLIEAIRAFDASMRYIYVAEGNTTMYEFLDKLCSTSFLRGAIAMQKINDGNS